jgi:hypothetical protein
MKQAFNLQTSEIQAPPERTVEANEFLQPFDVLTCSCCAGQWSREGGRTVQLGGFRYLLCSDCIEQEKLLAFMASRRRGPKNDFWRPIRRDDIITLIFALRER